MRDITLEDTFTHGFTTRAFATGIPTVLAATPVLSVLEGANATPITAGVSVSVDRASVVGLNEATIVATAANGYENGKTYSIYISTGTVGGVSVVGEIVGQFTIGASAAAVDLANATDGLGAIKGDTAEIGTAGAGLGDLGGMSTAMKAEVQAEVDASLVAIHLDHLLAVAAADVVVDGSVIAHMVSTTEDWSTFVPLTDALQSLRDRGDAAWTTGSGTGLTALASGTAQSGTASTIVLASGETFADNELNGNTVKITAGTGAGQSRVILTNTGADDTCNISPNWATNPSSDSVYEIVDGSVNISAVSNVAEAIATVAAIFANVMENSETFAEQVRIMRAESAGKVSVSGATVTFRNAADDGDRITSTTDANGQRTAVVTDGS